MMGYGNWGGSTMMASGFGLFGIVVWLAIIIDLVLLGLWLWKQINKK